MKLILPACLILVSFGSVRNDDDADNNQPIGCFCSINEMEFYNGSTVLGQEDSTAHITSIAEFSCQRFFKGEQVFEDNFDTMDWKKWQNEVRTPMDLDIDGGEFVVYLNRAENCYVNNGTLHIVPSFLSDIPGFDSTSIRNGTLNLTSVCTGVQQMECYRQAQNGQILPPIVSARIRTKKSYKFRFIKIEVRTKVLESDWAIPVILLEPAEKSYYGKYIAPINMLQDGKKVKDDEFYVYTLEWSEEFDNVNKGDTQFRTNQSFFITLGLSVGGHKYFPDSPGKPWKNLDPQAALNFWNARETWQDSYLGINSGFIVDYVRITAH